jgi:Na+/melibiose symporter-like transporter
MVRWLGSSIRMINLSNMAMVLSGGAMFILQMSDILQRNFILFLVLLALLMFSHGLNAVPSRMIGLECIDYNLFKTGKSMAGMINALSKLLGRITTALSTLAAGAVLAGVGYKVDAVSGNYAGDLGRLPELLNWIIVASGLVPAIFSGISILINRYYPIDADIRRSHP